VLLLLQSTGNSRLNSREIISVHASHGSNTNRFIQLDAVRLNSSLFRQTVRRLSVDPIA
jgi:hypothetical protein